MIKVEGLAELEKQLFQLGSTSTARRVGQRALLEAAKPMVERIKQLAPDDPKTAGALKESIKMTTGKRVRLNRGQGSLRGEFDSEDLATVVIGIDGDVRPHEWRPRKRGIRQGKNRVRAQRSAKKDEVLDVGVAGYSVMQEFGTEKMAANPFMRPGFDATAELVIRRVGQTLGPEIEKSAARLAKRQAKAG